MQNASAIDNLPGIDMLFLGVSDLTADLGHAGAKDDPVLWQAADTVVKVSRTAGKVPGMSGIVEGVPCARAMAIGMRWISATHDATLLHDAATNRFARRRSLIS